MTAGRLLQTPVASEGFKATFAPFEDVSGTQEFLTNQVATVHRDQAWGPYEPAIRRWERALGRVAPAPTNPDGKGGAHRLSPQFVEWLMGLPTGHVTDPSIGITRNEQLKALGNGVVPQQAFLAMQVAWPRLTEEVAA